LAEVNYVHSPNSLPPAGSVFVEGIGGGDGGAAYGWLAMYGYNKAPSSDQAAYVVHISDQIAAVDTSCTEGVDITTTKHGEKFEGNGDVTCSTLHAHQLDVVMRRQIQGQPATEPPLVEIADWIAVAGVDNPLFPLTDSARNSYLLESTFAIFPGADRTTKELIFYKSGDLVCIKTAGGFWSPTVIHCRKSDAPPGVLAATPASCMFCNL
jgi:hypothetical protein